MDHKTTVRLIFSFTALSIIDSYVLRNITKDNVEQNVGPNVHSEDNFSFESIRLQRLNIKSVSTNDDRTNSLHILKMLKQNETDGVDFDDNTLSFATNDSIGIINATNSIKFMTNNSTYEDDIKFIKNFTINDDKFFNETNVSENLIPIEPISDIEEIKKKLTEILKNYGTVNSVNGSLTVLFNTTLSTDNDTNSEYSSLNKISPLALNTSKIDNKSSKTGDKPTETVLSENPSESNPSSYPRWFANFEKSGYDKNVRPLQGIKPLEIEVSIHVIRVHSISESTMDFGLDIYYRENWTDARLAYDPSDYGEDILQVPSSTAELIWMPDTYFSNAIRADTEIPGSVTHRSMLRIYPTGNVLYIRKISITAACHMDLGLYPFDKQGCQLVICSYSYLKKDLYYKWRNGDPIDFQEKVRLPEFQLLNYRPKTVDEDYYIGTYSTLHLCLVFKRSAGFCIMQIFFPATAVVMSSWVSLWMEEETQFNDVLAVILAIIFLAYSYNSVMPRVSYVKLLDLYLAACFLFVFLSLSKLVILKYCRKKIKFKHESNQNSSSPMDVFNQVVLADEEESAIGSSGDESNGQNNCNGPKAQKKNKKLEKYQKARLMLQRRVTMAKIEMEKTQKNFAAEKRFLRYLRAFHVLTQLVLPLGFISFFVFILIIYPNWPRPAPC